MYGKRNSTMRKSEVKALKELFDKYNTTKDNWLDATELHEAVKEAGLASSNNEAYRIIACADRDADGKVDFEELHDYVLRQRQKSDGRRSQFSKHLDSQMFNLEKKYKLDDRPDEDAPPALRSPSNTIAYHEFDNEDFSKMLVIFNDNKNTEGELDMFQFMSALKTAGNFTQSEMCMLVVKADQNGDTIIDFNEFVTILWSNRDRLTINGPQKQKEKDKSEDEEKKSEVTSNNEEQKYVGPIDLENNGTRGSILQLASDNALIDDALIDDANESQDDNEREDTVKDTGIESEEESYSEGVQDDEKKQDNNDGSIPQLEGVKYFTSLSAAMQDSILSTSLELLGELQRQKMSGDEQLDFFTRLIAFQKSKTSELLDMCSANV